MQEALADTQLEPTSTSACREGVHVFLRERLLLHVTRSLSRCDNVEVSGRRHWTAITMLGVEGRLRSQQVFRLEEIQPQLEEDCVSQLN